MFCSSCGNKIDNDIRFCPNCGHKINDININNSYVSDIDKSIEGKRTASIVLGILSLVGIFIMIFAPISFILAIIGLILAIRVNKVVKNTAGIVLNAIGLFLSFIIISIIALVLIFSYNIIRNGPVDYGNYIDNYIEEHSNIEYDF